MCLKEDRCLFFSFPCPIYRCRTTSPEPVIKLEVKPARRSTQGDGRMQDLARAPKLLQLRNAHLHLLAQVAKRQKAALGSIDCLRCRNNRAGSFLALHNRSSGPIANEADPMFSSTPFKPSRACCRSHARQPRKKQNPLPDRRHGSAAPIHANTPSTGVLPSRQRKQN